MTTKRERNRIEIGDTVIFWDYVFIQPLLTPDDRLSRGIVVGKSPSGSQAIVQWNRDLMAKDGLPGGS